MIAVRERCLGPPDARRSGAGGTDIERDHRYISIKGGRSVSVGLQTQVQKSIVNPAAGGKYRGVYDEGLRLRHDLVSVRAVTQCYLQSTDHRSSVSSSTEWQRWTSICQMQRQHCGPMQI